MDEQASMMASPSVHQAHRRAIYAQMAGFADPDASDEFEDPGASPPDDTFGEEEAQDSMDDDEEDYAGSETSSAMFDPDADPEGWAARLDELAGVKEMGEEEARALRWGPPFEKDQEGEWFGRAELGVPLANSSGRVKSFTQPLDDFKVVINHYLDTTEWKYEQPTWLGPTTGTGSFLPSVHPMAAAESHPIPIHSSQMDRPEDDTQSRTPVGLDIHGTPLPIR